MSEMFGNREVFGEEPFKFQITEVADKMSNGAYHSRKEYSSSFIKGVYKHSVGRALNPNFNQESPALIFGDAFHETMELGELNLERFVVKPEKPDNEESFISVEVVEDKYGYTPAKKDIVDVDGVPMVFNTEHDGRTKMGKAWVSKNAHKHILTPDQVKDIYGMKESVDNSPSFKPFLDSKKLELRNEWSFFADGDDQHTKGMKFRVRPDVHFADVETEMPQYIFDYKTTDDIKKLCRWGFKDLGYDIQAVFYSDVIGISPKNFIFLAVEKSFPYTCRAIRLSDDSIWEARQKMVGVFGRIKRWQDNPDDKSTLDMDLPEIIEL